MRAAWLLAAVLVSVAAPARAISCGGASSLREAYRDATHVFLAHAEGAHTAPAFGREGVPLVRLRVERVWKGGLTAGDAVDASAEEDVPFTSGTTVPEVGTDVLVYAGGEPPFRLSACSRSGRATGHEADMRKLDRWARKRRPNP